MSTANRRLILRANALYLGIASIAAFILLDLRAIAFGAGPAAQLFGASPHAAIGFVEAHGLTGAAVMALLGVSNLVFWQIFTATGMTAAGVGLTTAHLAFAALQLLASSGPRARAAVS